MSALRNSVKIVRQIYTSLSRAQKFEYIFLARKMVFKINSLDAFLLPAPSDSGTGQGRYRTLTASQRRS